MFTDGQEVAIRVSKNFASTIAKMKKELEQLNLHVEEDIKLCDVLSPSSAIFDAIEEQFISLTQQKCVEAYINIKRGEQELQCIKKELEDMFSYLHRQYESISLTIEPCLARNDRLSSGRVHYLKKELFNLESLANSLSHISKSVDLSVDFPKYIHTLFQEYDSVQLNDILNEIDVFENEESIEEVDEEIELINDVEELDEDFSFV